MDNPFGIYVNSTLFRQVRKAESAETLVLRFLREGAATVWVNYQGHPCATFTPADLARPVWGKPETFLIEDIKRGVEQLKDLPPAIRGKNKRAVVMTLRDVFGCDEVLAVKALKELRPYLKNGHTWVTV